MNDQEISDLVTIALAGGKRRAVWSYRRFDALEKRGFTQDVSAGKAGHTHQITAAGIAAVLALPDDYAYHSYPLPYDVQKAKGILQRLLDAQH